MNVYFCIFSYGVLYLTYAWVTKMSRIYRLFHGLRYMYGSYPQVTNVVPQRARYERMSGIISVTSG